MARIISFEHRVSCNDWQLLVCSEGCSSQIYAMEYDGEEDFQRLFQVLFDAMPMLHDGEPRRYQDASTCFLGLGLISDWFRRNKRKAKFSFYF